MAVAVIQSQKVRLFLVVLLIGVVPACFLALYPLFIFILNPLLVPILYGSLVQAAYFYWIVASAIWAALLIIILPLMVDSPMKEQVELRTDQTVNIKDYRKSANYGSVEEKDSLANANECENKKLDSPDIVKECTYTPEQNHLPDQNSTRSSSPIESDLKKPVQGNISDGSVEHDEQRTERMQSLHSHLSIELPEKLQGINTENIHEQSSPQQDDDTKSNNDLKEKSSENSSNENDETMAMNQLIRQKQDDTESKEERINEPSEESCDEKEKDETVPMNELIRQKETQNVQEPMRCSVLTPLNIAAPDTREVFECSLPTPSSAKIKNQVFIFIPDHQNTNDNSCANE